MCSEALLLSGPSSATVTRVTWTLIRNAHSDTPVFHSLTQQVSESQLCIRKTLTLQQRARQIQFLPQGLQQRVRQIRFLPQRLLWNSALSSRTFCNNEKYAEWKWLVWLRSWISTFNLNSNMELEGTRLVQSWSMEEGRRTKDWHEIMTGTAS